MAKKKAKGVTPVRDALVVESALQAKVQNGIGAIQGGHRNYIEEPARSHFADSLEIDENLKTGKENENRWDYLLGHGRSECVVGLEPHSAKDDQISTVIRKRKSALDQLKPHLKTGAKIREWYWVASARNQFSDTEKTRRRLDQNGIKFVCPFLTAKHLDLLKK